MNNDPNQGRAVFQINGKVALPYNCLAVQAQAKLRKRISPFQFLVEPLDDESDRLDDQQPSYEMTFEGDGSITDPGTSNLTLAECVGLTGLMIDDLE